MNSKIKRDTLKRVSLCILGNLILALGVALAKYSALGTDPFNSMCLSASNALDISYPVFTWGLNLLLFAFEILWGRKYINIGTFINWILLSFFADIFIKLLAPYLSISDPYYIRIPLFISGVLLIALGVAIYQEARLGISPYDVVPFLILDRTKKVKYFILRVSLDAAAVLISLISGGITQKNLGIGTAVIALCLGPLIEMFTNLIFRNKKGKE